MWGKAYCGEDKTTTGDALSISHDKQCERAMRVENDCTEANIRDLGCHGLSPAVRHLDYVDYNNLFVVPICHAVLYGIVKSFWKLLLTPPAAGDDTHTHTHTHCSS